MGGRGSYSATYRRAVDFIRNEGKGQSKPRPMDVSAFAGMSLQQIEGRIRNLDHEELFVIESDGSVSAAYRGNKDSVAFHASVLTSHPGAIVTHGHPKGISDFGGTFSFADVYNMTMSNWESTGRRRAARAR